MDNVISAPSADFTLPTRGPFSLETLATFGYGHQSVESFDGVMRLAFCVDGLVTQAGVEVRQVGETLHCVLYGDAEPEIVRRQVARVLSVDHDGRAFVEVTQKDPVLATLHASSPGLRPPLFYSPYEAAVWSIISARRPRLQAAQLRERWARETSTTFLLAGESVPALPLPAQLAGLESFAGIPADRVPRLHALASAAQAGLLDVDHLTALGPEAAMSELQELPGIGPFYSSLIVIRACGLTDVLPSSEVNALELIRRLYDLPGQPTPAEFARLAEPWRPFRTWATVLIRATGEQQLAAHGRARRTGTPAR